MSTLPARVTREQLWQAVRTAPWEWDDAPRHGHQRWKDSGCYTHQVLRLGFIDLFASENVDAAVCIASEDGFSLVCAACAERMWPAPQGAEFLYKQSMWPRRKPRARRKAITRDRMKTGRTGGL
jgi:hypothetical protein